MNTGLFSIAARALHCTDPAAKCQITAAAWQDWQLGSLGLGDRQELLDPIRAEAGRPPRPQLVPPRNLKRRRLTTIEGRATLLHAVAHIEFNAINLAWDAVYRFRDFPVDYYADWLSVAADEARHFSMLETRLHALRFAYGDFPAHNGLWEMAVTTSHDSVARMALVPRVLEARGLDVTPGMMQRLQGSGDHESAAVLKIILQEEIRHVAIGSRWFKYACDKNGLEPESTFRELLQRHYSGRIRGPFNVSARLAAGFSEAEMDFLQASTQARPRD